MATTSTVKTKIQATKGQGASTIPSRNRYTVVNTPQPSGNRHFPVSVVILARSVIAETTQV